MKKIVLLFTVLFISSLMMAQMTMPNIHSAIMLDSYFFSGDGANDGIFENSNRFHIRKVALEFEGQLSDRMNYAVEFGVSSCVGTTSQLKLMEAELMYEVRDDLMIGLKQGHILDGFSSVVGCSSRLTMEKPDFVRAFGNCHPLGFVINNYIELGQNMGLESEIAIVNGGNGTLDDEYEANIGFLFETPLRGLSILTVYNHNEKQYYDHNFNRISKEGYKASFGANYLNHGLWLTGEYYTGKGFTRYDQEMAAWYIQAGYDIPFGLGGIVSIQPFSKYEFWDKDSSGSVQNEETVFEAGINFKLSAFTQVKMAFRNTDLTGDTGQVKPDVFMIRLLTSF